MVCIGQLEVALELLEVVLKVTVEKWLEAQAKEIGAEKIAVELAG